MESCDTIIMKRAVFQRPLHGKEPVMGNTFVKRLITVVIALLLIVYVGFQIYNANYSQVKTETVSYMTTADSIQTNGFVVREEQILEAAVDGVLTFSIDNGGKVAQGGVVAEIYANAEDADAQKRISELNADIERLRQLGTLAESFTITPDALDKQLTLDMHSLLEKINDGELLRLASDRENLLYQLNERQLITGAVENFDARISELTAERDSLSFSHGGRTGTVTSPAAGYFVSETDGYEQAFGENDVLSLTPEQLKTGPQKNEAISENVIGKVISSFDWYITCVLSPEQAQNLYEGKRVYVRLPFATTERLPVTVAAVNQVNKTTEAAVILKCNYMNSELASLREELVSIDVETYTGLRVSKRAIHRGVVTRTTTNEDGEKITEEKEVSGVYVRFGSELTFKEIVPLYSDNSFVICDPDPDDEALFSGDTIQLYDEVVVEGTDLYDGKIIG